MNYYNREKLSKLFDKFYFSLFYLLFIDDFDVHRNNYCSFKTFYLTTAILNYKERRKIVNVFTLTLRSYETKIENIIKSISKFIRCLNKKVNLIINDETKFICSFNILLLNDMS